MFCPKCGTQNPDNGKYCRSCGTDLGNVSAVLSGDLTINTSNTGVAHINNEAKRRQDPNEVYGDAVKSIISGIGFLAVAFVLFFTGVAGGHAWWWAMLFPAFGLLSKGIADYLKSKRMENRPVSFSGQYQPALNQTPYNPAPLPPSQNNYVQIEQLIRGGNKIAAIKLYRETYGVGLAEAKNAVERIEMGQRPNHFQSTMPEPYQPPSIYNTGELPSPPPSVTENTTRHLVFNKNDGETLTLPKL
jgi:hypothetical protein